MASEIGVPGSIPDPVADSVPEMETSLDTGADAETDTAATDPIPDTITIHVLCPTLSATSRFTLNNMSLDSTVGNLRLRIQEIIPTHPMPINQTLIVRGRRVHSQSDSNILREALAPITVS
ncbi:hypothetical protein N7540_002574 [Penicillium herquei]|nr:hypothetical protein N7540_002574 [Penicillium herquei]